MTLEEFVNNITELAKENPGIMQMEVITASDDEGNSFHGVHCTPSIGHITDTHYGEFHSKDQMQKEPDEYQGPCNAVCVN